MQRHQRPLGLSLLCKHIHTSNTSLDEKTVYQLINYSLNHNLQYNDKPFTIETLSELLGISKAQAYKYYLQHTSKVASLVNPSELQGLYLGQTFHILAGASGTLSQIRYQRQVLQAAQGNRYIPFLSEQVNSILSTEMAAHKNLSSIAESLLKTADPRSLPNHPENLSGTNEKAISVTEALKLLEAEGHLTLAYSKEKHQGLIGTHGLLETPQVIANLQVGNTEDQALIKLDNKKHHRSRRAQELQIDEEESI